MSKKPEYIKIGSMLLDQEKDEQGRAKYYIKLDEKVEITINGKKFNGTAFKVERPTDKYDRMAKAGKLDPKEHKAKLDLYSDGGKANFVKFEIEAVIKE
jgi:hypothetical protein